MNSDRKVSLQRIDKPLFAFRVVVDSYKRPDITSLRTAYQDLLDNAKDISPDVGARRLVSSLFNRVLSVFPYDELSSSKNRLEWRDGMSLKADLGNGIGFDAQDDGGLRLRTWMETVDGVPIYDQRTRNSGCFRVLLECKKGFQKFEDGRPIGSRGLIGQMTAISIAARCERRLSQDTDPYVHVIAAARQFVAFHQVHITEEYLADIITEKPKERIPIAGTQWLDMLDNKDREEILQNILELVQDVIG